MAFFSYKILYEHVLWKWPFTETIVLYWYLYYVDAAANINIKLKCLMWNWSLCSALQMMDSDDTNPKLYICGGGYCIGDVQLLLGNAGF